VSWSLASGVLLALALAAGFAWYERTHPSARVLALVATMAALAAAGRIAFAPLPSVKPTTDVVLIAGAALGGAPGFAVGAIAALTSNFFFGQGPWTPWQMAGWGLAGLLGAALARASGREPGRLQLALACAFAGLVFGAVMNVSSWVTFSGDHSLAALGALWSAALPFDLAHMAGNFVFALAFGPALLGAVARFRRRLDVTWLPAPGAAAALAALAATVALAAPGTATAAGPADYLVRAQNPDGGWGAARGQGSSQLFTGWAALGLAAAGRNPLDVRRGGRSPVSYVRGLAGQVEDTGELERTILVLGAAGVSPRRFAGRDLVRELERRRRPDGGYAGGVVLTSFAVLALDAAGRGDSRGVRASLSWLARQQNPDGSFSALGRGSAGTVDDTASAVQALAAGGRPRSRAARRAAAFLVRVQNVDGGYPLRPGGPSNAQSTAYATQGLLAARRDPARVRRGGSRSPLGYLRTLVAPDGSVRYSRTSDQTPVWVTAQALMALERRPLPIARVPRAGRAARASAPAGAGPRAPARAAAQTRSEAAGDPVPMPVLLAAHRLGIALGWLMTPLGAGR
jgi:energy-coupling factor transport system substrate-specific component